MSIEDNVAVVRRHNDLLANYDDAAFAEIWADDVVFHEPHQVLRGREAGRKRYRAFRDAFGEVALTLHEVVAQGDFVAVRSTLRGVHEGTFAGVPATGKRVTLSGMGMFRLEGGRIVEVWGCSDFLGFLQQLGALPGSPAVDRGGGHE
jgi:steroid delta-isomerase-like uncharacterized protein